jgi:hypothetical protein
MYKSYQTRINRVKTGKGDFVADCHSMLAASRKHFSELLNAHGVNEVRQRELYTTEPLMPEPRTFVFEMAIVKLKSHK